MFNKDYFASYFIFQSLWYKLYIVASSIENIFCVTGPLWGESTGHWWIPCTKASDTKL